MVRNTQSSIHAKICPTAMSMLWKGGANDTSAEACANERSANDYGESLLDISCLPWLVVFRAMCIQLSI